MATLLIFMAVQGWDLPFNWLKPKAVQFMWKVSLIKVPELLYFTFQKTGVVRKFLQGEFETNVENVGGFSG
jgi:hypothetical protein